MKFENTFFQIEKLKFLTIFNDLRFGQLDKNTSEIGHFRPFFTKYTLFFYKNKVYKNVKPQLVSKTKNILYAEMEFLIVLWNPQ